MLFSAAFVVFLNLGNFLDVTTEPIKADVIVCLGRAGTDRTITALDLLSNGYATHNKLYYSGDEKSLRMISEDSGMDFNVENIVYMSKMKNTMDEILYIDNLVEKEKYSLVIIVTDPPHSRRVAFMVDTFSKNLQNKYIGVVSFTFKL